MKTYSLSAWLLIKQQQKDVSEHRLSAAFKKHEHEQAKLLQLETSLKASTFSRSRLDRELFLTLKDQRSGGSDIKNFASLQKKGLTYESELKATLLKQQHQIRYAKDELSLAQNRLTHAQRDLKLVEKHFNSWQQKQAKCEEKALEDALDEQNGMRFMRKG